MNAEQSKLFGGIQEWAREDEEEAQTYDDWLTMERYAPYVVIIIVIIAFAVVLRLTWAFPHQEHEAGYHLSAAAGHQG